MGDTTEQVARDAIEHARMRRALYKFLWDEAHKGSVLETPLPMPEFSDEEIKRRLQKVLGIGGFLGLF